MADIVRKWLITRLQKVPDLNPAALGTSCSDGHLIARILYSYEIITSDQLDDIFRSHNETANMGRISIWLQFIGIVLTESQIQGIVSAKSSAALSVLYEMYLALADKDRTVAVLNNAQRQLDPHPPNKFTVKRTEPCVERKSENILAEPLIIEKPLIDKCRTNQLTWKTNFQLAKQALVCHPEETCIDKALKTKPVITYQDMKSPYDRWKEEMLNYELKYCCVKKMPDYNYCELLAMRKKTQEMMADLKIDPCKAVDYIQSLKHKAKLAKERKILEQRVKSWIIEDFYNATEKCDDTSLNNEIANKLLKQSQFEKQISTQVKEIENIRDVENQAEKIIDELACSMGENSNIILQDLKRGKDYDNENIKMEKDRNWDLHKRLYAEKMRLQHQHTVTVCEDSVSALVDLAIRVGDYHEDCDEEVPLEMLGEWKSLFIHGLPIFDIMKNPEDLLENVEEIIHLELERQETMNEHDFQEYHLRQNAWDMRDYINSEDFVAENDGLLVGHVVHCLLEAKYPEPPPNPPADIPEVDVCSILIGVEDPQVLDALQILLRYKKIKTVDAVEVINYCFAKYREEGKIVIEEEFVPHQPPVLSEARLEEIYKAEKAKQAADAAAAAAAEAAKSPKGKGAKSPKEKGGKSPKGPPGPPPSLSIIHKETQTPIEIPQIVILSETAQLGIDAYQCLVEGGPIPDKMYIDMLVQYLKTLSDYKGWCIVGFPETSEQAYVFETVMTGKEPEIGLCLFDSLPEREIDKKITSKILPNPHPRERPPDLPTILTSYVNIMKYREDDIAIEKISLFSTTDKLINFYLNQGTYYDQYYTCFDVSTVKKIAKIIIGDYSLPWKPSEELFGFKVGVEEPNPFFHPEKPESPDRGSYGVENDIFERIPGGMVMDVRTIEASEEVNEEDYTCIPIAREYVKEPAPVPALESLATMWENTECVYINEVTQLMFARRRHFVATPVYLTHMRKHMKNFVARPALNQDAVYDFQRQYNELNPDLRSDDEVKAELHCRLAELYNILMELCETRMNQALEERTRIMCLNWPADELTFLTNIFISAMQVELDRSYDTFQILSDFYIYMFQKLPTVGKQNKTTLSRMKIDAKDNTECDPEVAHVRSVMLEIFLMRVQTDTPMNTALRLAFETAAKQVKVCCETFIKPVLDAGKPPPPPTSKASPKKGKASPPLDDILMMTEDPDALKKREFILKEANDSFDAEAERVLGRLQLLLCRASEDLIIELRRMQNLFDSVLDYILNRFEQEKQSVIRLCEVLAAAIEREERIQSSLLLEEGGFTVEPTILLFPDSPPPPPSPVEEVCPVNSFKVGQLGKLKDIFMDISPDGVMAERAFTYLLADLISLIKIDNKKTLPSHWGDIGHCQVPELVEKMYGKVEGVSWKDFIIYNLDIDFPTENELLAARKFFRNLDPHLTETVTREEYSNFKFWWEKPTDDRRIMFRYFLTRELLFCLYEVEPDVMNYTAMLLGFCKDNDAKLGLAKAFLLCLGQKVCWDIDKGSKYNLRMSRKREQRRLEEESRQKAAKDGYDKAVEITVQVVEGIFVKEFYDPETILSPIIDQIIENVFDDNEEEEIGQGDLIKQPDDNQEEEGVEEITENILYEICFKPAFQVISAAVPWSLAQPKLSSSRSLECGLKKVFKELDKFEDKVYIYQLLEHEFITELLTEVYKFKVKQPKCIVANILGLMDVPT